MGHSGKLEAHSGTEVEVRSGTAVDHFETDSVVRSGKETVHFGIVEDRSGTTEDCLGIEVESQARLAG